MTPAERQRLIAQYRAGHAEVAAALDGFPEDALTARLLPGKWTAAEIVHHLADSEGQSATRLRKLLAEAHPVIQGYEQDAWATQLRYNERAIGPALLSFRASRETTAQLLDRMTEADWHRSGWHSEAGLYTAERWLEIYAVHAHEHAAQIRRLREAAPR